MTGSCFICIFPADNPTGRSRSTYSVSADWRDWHAEREIHGRCFHAREMAGTSTRRPRTRKYRNRVKQNRKSGIILLLGKISALSAGKLRWVFLFFNLMKLSFQRIPLLPQNITNGPCRASVLWFYVGVHLLSGIFLWNMYLLLFKN